MIRFALMPAILVGLIIGIGTLPQGVAGPSAQSLPLHVLKISAGPSGSEAQGVFVFTEERSVFNRAIDREAIVFFQWEGAPGTHRMAATWRSPDGAASSSSSFSYTAAGRRFAGYWRLALSPAMVLGTWSIEATVDDQPAGRFTFEITDATVPRGLPTKRPLSRAELFDRLSRITMVLQRASAAGRESANGAALAMPSGRLFTAMAALDDADRIRVVSVDGTSREASSVLAWNRAEDWAVLNSAGPAEISAPVEVDEVKVGTRCYSIESAGPAGGRVLVEGQVTGQGAGALWIASFASGMGTPGAPLLNEFGDAIGIIGGANAPGALRLDYLMQLRGEMNGAPVIPIRLIRGYEAAVPVTLSELRARGELITALAGDQHVSSGGFAASVSRNGMPAPIDSRNHFSVHEKGFVVFVNWFPDERLKGVAALKIFDARNKLVAQSKPAKRDLRKREYVWNSWDFAMLSAPGLYRADLMFNDNPIWRGYVRISP